MARYSLYRLIDLNYEIIISMNTDNLDQTREKEMERMERLETATVVPIGLRSLVLGANDGIVSIASLVVGVAGANTGISAILLAGLAGVIAGALSMAAGEFVSVSSERDAQKVILEHEKEELKEKPEAETHQLERIYRSKGLSVGTAKKVAEELTAHDALTAHIETESGINLKRLANPWVAAASSAGSFVVGSIIPMLAILLPPAHWRVPVTFAAVIVALAINGSVSARIGGANIGKAALRVVAGGFLAMVITYGVGLLFGVSGI